MHANRTSDLRIDIDAGTVILTMNRPERRNALSLAMMRELTLALGTYSQDPATRAFVLAAEGSAFSAGHDLRELQACGDAEAREIFAACVELMQTIQRVPQPVIAEVAGVATAAGCQLVATCDLALASPQATFATPGVRIGLFCSTPKIALVRCVGRKRAMQMLLTGDPIDATTAAVWGLINDVVPAAQLRAGVLAKAAHVAQASPLTLAIGKQAFYETAELPQSAAYARASEIMTANLAEPDAREGIAAFLERRSPHFKI
jgi:enoyl-CoA hydratase/carnithine racemase